MTRFRIMPYGADRWKVQTRWLFLWVDVTVLVGHDTYDRVSFDLEEEAESWIDRHHEREREWQRQNIETARRKGHYVPREYP